MKRREKVENAATPLDIAVRRSVAMLFAERLWRLCVALSTLALAFLALSFAGLWREVGPHWRMLGVAVFAQAALFLILKEIWRGRPGRGRALARLDAGDASGLRPAASLDDALGNGGDAATDALWAAHRRRLEEALQAKPIAPPHPETARRDPYALRALALLAAVAAAFVAGGDKTARLRAAFDWEGAGFSAERARFDAVIRYEDFVARDPAVLETMRGLGWPVEEDFYNYRRRHNEMLEALWRLTPGLMEHFEFVFGNVRGTEVSERFRDKPRDAEVGARLEKLCPRLLAHYRARD